MDAFSANLANRMMQKKQVCRHNGQNLSPPPPPPLFAHSSFVYIAEMSFLDACKKNAKWKETSRSGRERRGRPLVDPPSQFSDQFKELKAKNTSGVWAKLSIRDGP